MFNTLLRLFVDMDGTLAEWKHTERFEVLYEPNYFSSLRPYINVVRAIGILIENRCVEGYSLSATLTDSRYAIPDKNTWLDRYVPEINKEHRIFVPTGTQKHKAVPGGIRRTDILLDDYTKNLSEWSKHAVAIKLMNGLNGTNGTWRGPRVGRFAQPEEIAEYVLRVAQTAYAKYSVPQKELA